MARSEDLPRELDSQQMGVITLPYQVTIGSLLEDLSPPARNIRRRLTGSSGPTPRHSRSNFRCQQLLEASETLQFRRHAVEVFVATICRRGAV
jgi:hypothetical protein